MDGEKLTNRTNPDGTKKVPINSDFVNPAFKPEVPDYRTEYEVIKAGADSWDESATGYESDEVQGEESFDSSEAEDKISRQEPFVLTPDHKVDNSFHRYQCRCLSEPRSPHHHRKR